MVTVFGYSAPKSDTAAVGLFLDAWGGGQKRMLEQFEIIDVRAAGELRKAWSNFICDEHYQIHSDYFDSWLAKHPRRSGGLGG
jgi:hypothetical protein